MEEELRRKGSCDRIRATIEEGSRQKEAWKIRIENLKRKVILIMGKELVRIKHAFGNKA